MCVCFTLLIGTATFFTRMKQGWMRGRYRTLHSSRAFLRSWGNFLLIVVESVSPSFYQHVTNLVFMDLVKIDFPPANSTKMASVSEVTGLEESVL